MTNNKINKWLNKSNRLLVFIVCIVMVVISGVVGVVMMVRSVAQLKTVLWNHMESVSNMAASLIDGDELELITEADAPTLDEDGRRIADGSARSCAMEQILVNVKNAQKDMHIPYIYIVRYENGKLVFIVDPDIDAPGAYGQEIVYTPSQAIAWAGQSKVDDVPYSDEWGTYYTAWSPIRNSDGKVVGLVGVDFEATEMTEQMNFSLILVITSTCVLLLLCIASFILYSVIERKRSEQLVSEIADLSDNLKTMFDEIEGIETTGEREDEEEDYADEDFANYVHRKTIAMTKRLRKHTSYMEQQANIDFMTKTGNTRAYTAEKDKFQAEIEKGTADFAVAIFDINNLKEINDNYGHEYGDKIITTAADVLKKIFAVFNVYRIGGDEFAVILPSTSAKAVELAFGLVDEETNKANKHFTNDIKLSISKGYSIFNPETDKDYREVFMRADQRMYAEKEIFHKNQNKNKNQ